MGRKPLTVCEGCGCPAPVVATGSPGEHVLRMTQLAIRQGWGYERGWYCRACVAAMPPERRKKVRRHLTEAQQLLARRTRYHPVDKSKSPTLNPATTSQASFGRPWPRELDFEEKRLAAKLKLEELRKEEGLGAAVADATAEDEGLPDYQWPWESSFEAKRREARRKLDELRHQENKDSSTDSPDDTDT